MTLTIGLTGGIASGKSVVADRLRSHDIVVIDADEVSRFVVLPGQPGLQQIVLHFGNGALDEEGQLDRRKMRERVFNDDGERRLLERILHPLIRTELERRRNAARGPYRVLMIPIMVKTGMTNLVDRVLVVDTPEEMQLMRLMQRDDIDESLAHRMMAAQESRAERLSAADDVILNSGDLPYLWSQVDRLHHDYLRLAGGEVIETLPHTT